MKVSTVVLAASLAAPTASQAPSAALFARLFVRSANAYAVAHHDPRRLSHAHCVEASPAQYMCSYVALTPRAGRQCHLVQAQWTPTRASTITVTLSGRTRRCGSLRQAIRSLP